MSVSVETAKKTPRNRRGSPCRLPAALLLWPGAVVGLMVVSSVHAQDSLELAPIELRGTPIGLRFDSQSGIGSRLGLSLDEVPGQVDVIDQMRMQERGNRNTTEAVTGSVGFSDNSTLGNLSSFSARGFTDVQVLYDGMRLGAPGMTVRPQGTWIYERVETISGPAAVLHGEGSIVGAVNYVPRRPNPVESETDVLLSAGSFNSNRVAAGHGGPTNIEGLSFRIDGERQSSDGFLDNGDSRQEIISGSLRYDATDRLRFNVNVVYLDDDLPAYSGKPVDEDGNLPSVLDRANLNPTDASITGEEIRFTLDADYLATERLQIRNRFWYYKGERDWVNVEGYAIEEEGFSQGFAFSLDHDQTFFSNRTDALIDHRLFGRDARSVLGAQLSRDDFRSGRSSRPGFNRQIDDPRNPGQLGSVRDIDFDRSENIRRSERDTLALFAENQFDLGAGISIVSGLRGERIRVKVDNTVGDERRQGSETFTTQDARLGLVWEATRILSVFAQATSGSQFQLNPNIPAVDDLDTALQRSTGFEGGLRGRAIDGTWQFQVTAFDIEKRKRLVSDPTPENPDRRRQVGRQTSQGIELSGYWELLERLTLEGNASFLSAEFRNDPAVGGNTPSGVPKQLGNAWATVDVSPRIRARAHVQYVGEQQAANDNALQIPSYTLLNLSGSYDFDHNWTVTGRVRNVTDEQYFTSAWFGNQFFQGDGRAFEVQLSASF